MVSSGTSPERVSHTYDKADVERINTLERAGTNAQYYEKDGLRTEGDGVDHDGTDFKVSNIERCKRSGSPLMVCSSHPSSSLP